MNEPNDIPARNRTRDYRWVSLLLPLAVFFLFAWADEHNRIIEDQFITLRYAQNLVAGHGLTFHPGERVEGFSNPLWVLLMTPPFLFGFGELACNRLVCLALAGLSLVLL